MKIDNPRRTLAVAMLCIIAGLLGCGYASAEDNWLSPKRQAGVASASSVLQASPAPSAAPGTCDPCKVNSLSISAYPQTDFPGRSSISYGLREEAGLYVAANPAGSSFSGTVSWSSSNSNIGTVQGTGSYATFQAQTTDGFCVITATIIDGSCKGKTASIGLWVNAPSATALARYNNKVYHEVNVFSVGFLVTTYLLPRDVSFDKITVAEDYDFPRALAQVSGWFDNPKDKVLRHQPGAESTVDPPESATKGSALALIDQVGGRRNPSDYPEYNKPWDNGTLIYDIPVFYQSSAMAGWIKFTNQVHKLEMDPAGTATISKTGQGGKVGPESKAIGAASSPWQ